MLEKFYKQNLVVPANLFPEDMAAPMDRQTNFYIVN